MTRATPQRSRNANRAATVTQHLTGARKALHAIAADSAIPLDPLDRAVCSRLDRDLAVILAEFSRIVPRLTHAPQSDSDETGSRTAENGSDERGYRRTNQPNNKTTK